MKEGTVIVLFRMGLMVGLAHGMCVPRTNASQPEAGCPRITSPPGWLASSRRSVVTIPADALNAEEMPPDWGESDHDGPDFLNADIGDFINKPKTARAREYEKKTAATLNAWMRWAASNPNSLPDAAALIAYGDGFASATGEVAATSEHARKMIDFITSPSNPYITWVMAAMPLAAQLFRNHEPALAQVPGAFKNRKQRKAERGERPKVTFRMLGRTFTVPFRVHINFRFLRSRTAEPAALTEMVFSNEQVIHALKKRGIDVAPMPPR